MYNYFDNQPYYPQQRYGYQPQQQQPVQPTANIDWIRVNTMEEAEHVQVMPGQKKWIMLTNDPIFVLRVADNMGLTTTEAYRFEKINSTETKAKTEYVTREEFNAFVNSINGVMHSEEVEK